jgi:GT2 family glycosyltransferase
MLPTANDSPESPQRVYVVVLNWNGWRDTIQCLESVFQLRGLEFCAVVCDNASSNNSIEKIENWARGNYASEPFNHFPNVPVGKPLTYKKYTRSMAESGPTDIAQLVIIDNQENLGFAGGCNVGIRYALTRKDCSFVWLLNNDTVVPPDALIEMVKLCHARPDVGLCGSQVRYYDRPDMVQTFGGLLNPWFCSTISLACGDPVSSLTSEPAHIDFVPGASMLVTRGFLEQVGLMEESYFLYFEEIDWAERAKGKFKLAVCLTSHVYHHGSMSIGTPSEPGERGIRSEFYLLRGRLLFARRFYRARLPIVYLSLLASIAKRLQRRQWKRAHIATLAFAGIKPAILKKLN